MIVDRKNTAFRHIVEGLLLFSAHVVSALLPPTRGFGVRRFFFRLAGIRVGHGARIAGGVRFYYSNVSIGRDTWVGPACYLFSTPTACIDIGDRVDIAPGCFLITGSHEIGSFQRRAGLGFSRSISIGDGVWICAKSTILGGSVIGKGCIVAAGAVVKGIFPDNVLIGGVPARVIKELDS